MLQNKFTNCNVRFKGAGSLLLKLCLLCPLKTCLKIYVKIAFRHLNLIWACEMKV